MNYIEFNQSIRSPLIIKRIFHLIFRLWIGIEIELENSNKFVIVYFYKVILYLLITLTQYYYKHKIYFPSIQI